MLPDIDSLRCFEAAAVRLSFRAAANAVALSPPAFSERIRKLEELLGVTLFERSTRSVRLTPEGERLLPQARATLEAARRCTELSGQVLPWELTLGTRFELGMSWLVPALGPLREAVPERRIHLLFADTPDLMAALGRGTVDAVIGSMRLSTARLETALLHEEAYRFVGPPGARIEGPDDAPAHGLVDISADLPLFRYWQDGVPAEQVWRFGSVEYMGTIGAVRARVLAGAGVAVLPEYFVRADIADGSLVELLPAWRPRPDWFRLVWRAGHPRGAELQGLAAELRALPLR